MERNSRISTKFVLLVSSVISLAATILMALRQSGMPLIINRYSAEAFTLMVICFLISLGLAIVALFASKQVSIRVIVIGAGIVFATLLVDIMAYPLGYIMPYEMWQNMPYQVKKLTYVHRSETDRTMLNKVVEENYWKFNPYHCEKWALLSHFGSMPPAQGESAPEYEVCHDEIGFRNPAGTYSDNAEVEIVTLGDSFTYGFAVLEPWPDHLREYSDLRVLNLANIGGSVPEWISTFRDYGILKQPEIVIAATWDANDFIGLEVLDQQDRVGLGDHPPEEAQMMGVIHEVRGNNPLMRITEFSLSATLIYRSLSWGSGNLLDRKSELMSLDLDGADVIPLWTNRRPDIGTETSWTLYERGLRELKQDTVSAGSELVLVYFTTATVVYAPYEVSGLDTVLHDLDNYREISHRLADISQDLEIYYLDPTSILQQRAGVVPILYLWDGHFSEHGHKVIAEIVYSYLVEQGLVQSGS